MFSAAGNRGINSFDFCLKLTVALDISDLCQNVILSRKIRKKEVGYNFLGLSTSKNKNT